MDPNNLLQFETEEDKVFSFDELVENDGQETFSDASKIEAATDQTDTGISDEESDTQDLNTTEAFNKTKTPETQDTNNTQTQEPATPVQQSASDVQLKQLVQTYLPALENENKTLKDEVARVKETYAGLEQLNTQLTQNNVTPQEVTSAIQISQQWKTNPVQLVQNLLQTLKNNGIEVPDAPAVSFTPDAVLQQVRQEFAPLLQTVQQSQQREQVQREAQTQWQNFVRANPEADLHQDVLANVLQQNPNMTLQDAYVQTVRFAAINGLDIRKPLGPQYQAKQNVQQQQIPAPKPVIPSYNAGNGQVAPVTTPTNSTDTIGKSYKDIVRETLRELRPNG